MEVRKRPRTTSDACDSTECQERLPFWDTSRQDITKTFGFSSHPPPTQPWKTPAAQVDTWEVWCRQGGTPQEESHFWEVVERHLGTSRLRARYMLFPHEEQDDMERQIDGMVGSMIGDDPWEAWRSRRESPFLWKLLCYKIMPRRWLFGPQCSQAAVVTPCSVAKVDGMAAESEKLKHRRKKRARRKPKNEKPNHRDDELSTAVDALMTDEKVDRGSREPAAKVPRVQTFDLPDGSQVTVESSKDVEAEKNCAVDPAVAKQIATRAQCRAPRTKNGRETGNREGIGMLTPVNSAGVKMCLEVSDREASRRGASVIKGRLVARVNSTNHSLGDASNPADGGGAEKCASDTEGEEMEWTASEGAKAEEEEEVQVKDIIAPVKMGMNGQLDETCLEWGGTTVTYNDEMHAEKHPDSMLRMSELNPGKGMTRESVQPTNKGSRANELFYANPIEDTIKQMQLTAIMKGSGGNGCSPVVTVTAMNMQKQVEKGNLTPLTLRDELKLHSFVETLTLQRMHEFMRQPVSGERQCVNGMGCVGLIMRVSHPVVLREFLSIEQKVCLMNERRMKEQGAQNAKQYVKRQNTCILCKLVTSNAHTLMWKGNSFGIPDQHAVTTDFRNMPGMHGDVSPHDCLFPGQYAPNGLLGPTLIFNIFMCYCEEVNVQGQKVWAYRLHNTETRIDSVVHFQTGPGQ